MHHLWRLGLLTTMALVGCRGAEQADLLLINGNFYTLDPENPRAVAMAVKDGRILAVGGYEQVSALAGRETSVINLNGNTAVPGLIDSHGHLLGLGESLREINLVGTESYEEVVDLVAEKVKEAERGGWIQGFGWDQNDWPIKEFPTHQALSRVSPESPVWLSRIDGHAGLANARAMELAGVTAETPDPNGGRIVRDRSGRPTGVFIDRATRLITRHIPASSPEERRDLLRQAVQEGLALGLTGVHDPGVGRETLAVLREMAEAGELGLRVYAMVRGSDEELVTEYLARGPLVGLGDGRLTIRSVKLIADGALGSRGAALLEEYSDDPGNRGLLILSEDEITRMARLAVEAGYQVNTHAIGDRANQLVLNAYETVLKEAQAGDFRFRIEHAQVIHPDDIPRFAKLNVIPSMQPTHATSDMPWAEDRLGPVRIKGAYAWRSLLETGAHIAGGSDFPVEGVNPLWGIYAAVTRQDHRGHPRGGWYPEERMTREKALKAFTIWAAEAAFMEGEVGSLESGKRADLVVFTKDIMVVPPEELLETEVLFTFVDGELVYPSNEEGAPVP